MLLVCKMFITFDRKKTDYLVKYVEKCFQNYNKVETPLIEKRNVGTLPSTKLEEDSKILKVN